VTKLDQFESVFKSASKERFVLEPVSIERVAVVTDLDEYGAALFTKYLEDFLAVLGDGVQWRSLHRGHFGTVKEMLELIEQGRPDLICTYRNLNDSARSWPYSLGVHLDVLTQVTSTPVLVLPDPDRETSAATPPETTSSVLVVTDHLTGQDRLVSYGAHFTAPDGTLFLGHVEDDSIFERYADVLSKIPSIDTAPATEAIRRQLLKEPADYIDSCRTALEAEGLQLRVESIVTMGHLLADYKRLAVTHHIDLMVINTKDEDQMAMHGIAYPLAVELRNTPLLML
jgi:hypothetical protein